MNKTFLNILLPILLCWILCNWFVRPERYNREENRYLAAAPSLTLSKLLDGSYGAEWVHYADDRVAARDVWTSFHSSAEAALGKRELNGVFIAENALMERLEKPDERTVENNIQGIRNYLKNHPYQQGFLMLVPSAAAVQPQKLPAFAEVWDQWQWIENTENQLKSDLTPVTLQETFSSHREEELYYRTDHHWTTLGAYYAYRELAEALGLPVRGLEEYTARQVSDSFNGTLYSKSCFRGIAPDVITTYSIGEIREARFGIGDQATVQSSLYFPEYLTKKDQYAVFLGPNQPLVSIRTGTQNGKKLLLFKDSYSHSFVPFLTQDYEEILLADLRYLNQPLSQLVKLEEYQQVVFLYSVDVFTHQMQTTKLNTLA